MESRFKFEQLREAPLIVDAIYEGGLQKNMGSEPLSKLLGVGNSGGFRPRKRKDKKKHELDMREITHSWFFIQLCKN